MRLCRAHAAWVCLLALAVLASGCGSDSDTTTAGDGPARSRPAPPASQLPSAEGKTLIEVMEAADDPAEVVVSPAAMAFYRGPNRYPFGVFKRDGTQISDARIALYFAKVPKLGSGENRKKKGIEKARGIEAAAQQRALDQPAVGPFPASIETLATKSAFRSQTTASEEDGAQVVYSARIDFPSNGEWRIAAIIREEDRTTATLLPSAVVGQFEQIPRPGDRAPFIHTPTPEDVGGDLSKITTRVPPDTQNQVDYADVLGKEPIVLLFATPQFCQSRVCGPVVDVAEQVKESYGDKAAFIHMEIFNDNDPNADTRPQVRAFHLPTEPWVFTIGTDRRIHGSIEGAFGVDALTDEVQELIGG